MWISGQNIFGNPRFKLMVLDYQCVTEVAVASSRLPELLVAGCLKTQRVTTRNGQADVPEAY